MKVTIIGAGSSYTPEIIDGLLGEECFAPLEIALYDLPEGAQHGHPDGSQAGVQRQNLYGI